jgi:hypothetical protein
MSLVFIEIAVTPNVFVMDDNGEICRASQATLAVRSAVRDMHYISLIEKDGQYAYSEFFQEGIWPDEYYENEALSRMYRGIRLKIIRGGWCDNLCDLIQSISSEIDVMIEDEGEEDLINYYASCVKTDGQRMNIHGRDVFRIEQKREKLIS